MKFYLIAVILLTFSVVSLKAQQLDCANFHNGTFKIDKSPVGVYIITRHGDVQTEHTVGDTTTFTFTVKWIDDCTYTLTPGKDFLKHYPALPANAILKVRILKTTKDSYFQESSTNFSDLKATSEIVKIGD